MSELAREEVEKVALLARLQLSPEEIQGYQKDLSAIVGFMQSLGAVDTSQVEATLGVQPHTDVYRKDEVRASLGADGVLANAPHREGDAFQIPRILEES